MKASRTRRLILVCLSVSFACATANVPQELRSARGRCQLWAMNRCAGVFSCADENLRRCVAALGWTRRSGRWMRVRTEADVGREIDALIAEERSADRAAETERDVACADGDCGVSLRSRR